MEQKEKRRGWSTSLQRSQGSSKGIRKYVIVHGKIVKDTTISTGSKGGSSCSTTGKHCRGDQGYLKQLTLDGFITKSKKKHRRLSTAPANESPSSATMPWEKGVPASVITRGVRKKASSVILNIISKSQNTGHEDKENVLKLDAPYGDPIPNWRSGRRSEEFHSRVSSKNIDSYPRVTHGLSTVTFGNGRRRKNDAAKCDNTRYEGHKQPKTETAKVSPGLSTLTLSNCERQNNAVLCIGSEGCEQPRTETSVVRETSPNVVLGRVTKDSNQCSGCKEGPLKTGFSTDENSVTLEGQKLGSEGYADTDELLAELSYYEKITI